MILTQIFYKSIVPPVSCTPGAVAKTRFRLCPRCASACLHPVINARVVCVNCGAGIEWLTSHEEASL
jgi:hypothetical protein